MKNYKIKVNIEIVESEDELTDGPEQVEEGGFEFNISNKQAGSIDECEQALLQTNYAAMREALALHLTELSKKKQKNKQKEEEKS